MEMGPAPPASVVGDFTGMTAWDKILERMERRVNPHSFSTWFRPTRQEGADNGKIVVRVPSKLFRKRLTETYGEYLQAVLAELDMADTQIDFQCPATEPAPATAGPTGAAPRQARLDFESIEYQLNPRYLFETFIVGASNQFAHAAALAVAEDPSRAYNPLFLYGGVGMGKTHLMQAVGHLIKKRNPAVRLTYISAEKFTNEVINSLRFDRMLSFRERFRSVDVLLVDDIQFIAGKERTQEEFFHTFNALYELQRQIVVSSDCLPKEISAIEERLRSRFEWGLIADIQPPDLETKVAILQKKSEQEKVTLPNEVALYIASNIRSNVRELEGALIRLVAHSSLIGAEITLPYTQQVLKNFIDSQARKVTIESIQKAVAEQFGLRLVEIKAKNNARAIVYPRQIAMYLAKHLTEASLPEIGRQFGGKHHTTVLHSVEKIDAVRKTDKDLNRLLNKLTEQLGG